MEEIHHLFLKIYLSIRKIRLVFLSFLLSSVGGVLLAVNERFIGGNGGLVRLEIPTVELYGVRGLVS
jgi:hypothetical protein